MEVLYGYPLDGVVLLSGCDKTTPALIMAAATVNIPAIVMNVGPMLNGYSRHQLVGSGTVVWQARKQLASKEIDYSQFLDVTTSSAPSVGECKTYIFCLMPLEAKEPNLHGRSLQYFR